MKNHQNGSPRQTSRGVPSILEMKEDPEGWRREVHIHAGSIVAAVRSHSRLRFFCESMDCRLPVGLSRQEFWSGLPFPTPGDLPNPRIETASPALAGGFFTREPPGKLTASITSHRIFTPTLGCGTCSFMLQGRGSDPSCSQAGIGTWVSRSLGSGQFPKLREGTAHDCASLSHWVLSPRCAKGRSFSHSARGWPLCLALC